MVFVRHYLLPFIAILFMQILQPLHEAVAHGDGHEKAFVDCEFCLHVQDAKVAAVNDGFILPAVIAAFLSSEISVSLSLYPAVAASARGPPVL